MSKGSFRTPTQERYLDDFRKRFTAEQMLEQLGRSRHLRVLVVGEAIIDEYYFCSAIGQSMRAPVVSARYESHRRFASRPGLPPLPAT